MFPNVPQVATLFMKFLQVSCLTSSQEHLQCLLNLTYSDLDFRTLDLDLGLSILLRVYEFFMSKSKKLPSPPFFVNKK